MRKMYSEEQIKNKALESINASYEADGTLEMHDPVHFNESVQIDGGLILAPYPIVEVQITDADWNEDYGYIKRINVNNCVLHITGIGSLTHDDNIWIYNKYLELLKTPFEYTGFYGFTSDEEERAIYFEKSDGGYLQLTYPYIFINNGIVSFLTDQWEL